MKIVAAILFLLLVFLGVSCMMLGNRKESRFGVTLLIGLLMLLLLVFGKASKEQERACNAAHGMVIRATCFDSSAVLVP